MLSRKDIVLPAIVFWGCECYNTGMKLTEQQQRNIAAVGKEYDLKFLILPGSYATDSAMNVI